MIRYTLKCGDGHQFDSWFASSDAFDALKAEGLLSCAICGGGGVEKALMAPALSHKQRKAAAEAAEAALAAQSSGAPSSAAQSSDAPASKAAAGGADAPAPAAPDAPAPSLSAPASPMEAAIRELRRRVEAGAENVGRSFAREARRIHEGESEARPIYGEASGREVRDLAEDGIDVTPLPWTTRRDA